MKRFNMIKIWTVILLLSLPSIALADREDWYFMFNFGFANHDHPGELDAAFDYADSFPGVDRFEFAMDLFGFYFPLAGQNTMAGFALNSSTDSLTSDYGGDISLNTYLYAASGVHYFGTEIGDGFFLRGDIGLARAVLISDSDTESSDWGTGFLLGAGFALPLSSETRLIFGVNLADRRIEGESYKVTEFTIGGLW